MYTARDGRPLVAVETKPPFKEKIRRFFGMRPKRYIVYTPALGFQSGSGYRNDLVPHSSVRITTTGGSHGRRSSSSRRRY